MPASSAGRRSRRPARRASASSSRRVYRAPRVGRRFKLITATVVTLGVAVALLLPDVEKGIREVTLPLRHEDVIRQQARSKGVDPSLIAAVIYAESRFRDQTSYAGARGLMQITPDTADTIEKLSGGKTFTYNDLAVPELNIRYGTFYLRYLLDRYDGNEAAALAAYNAGPGKADEWGGSDMGVGDIEINETRSYVDNVLEKRRNYAVTYPRELGLTKR